MSDGSEIRYRSILPWLVFRSVLVAPAMTGAVVLILGIDGVGCIVTSFQHSSILKPLVVSSKNVNLRFVGSKICGAP